MSSVGPRLAEMVRLNLLATHPDHQGKGYGGALVDAVTAFADAQVRATVLLSTDESNTVFYESHGFATFVKVMIGDDDQTWDKAPIPIRVVSPSSACQITENATNAVLIDDPRAKWVASRREAVAITGVIPLEA